MNCGRIEDEAGEPVIALTWLANRPWTRFRGLLGRPALARDEGLLIDPCGSVHTIGMRYPIDVVFLDRQDIVVKIVNSLKPYRMARSTGARKTLELAAGTAGARGLYLGQRLVFSEPE